MLFKNVFNALVLAAVVTAGPANLLARADTALILCSEPNSAGACSDIHKLDTTCFNLPAEITTRSVSAALSGPGFQCTLFQGLECTGTSVVVTPADGAITISNIESVQCANA